MHSSTPKRWFYANWIKLFSILEKKSTSAQYVAKFVQCRIAWKEQKIFEHLLYFYTGRGQTLFFNTGNFFFVSRNAKWCLILLFWSELILLILLFWSELTLFGLNRTIKHLLVVLLRTWVTQVQKIANFWESFKSSRNTWFCVEWTPPLLWHDFMPIGLNYFQFWRKESTSAQYVTKFVQCNIARKELTQ